MKYINQDTFQVILKENIERWNKLFDKGFCPDTIRHEISVFEFVWEHGTKDNPHPKSHILPMNWKRGLKIFEK